MVSTHLFMFYFYIVLGKQTITQRHVICCGVVYIYLLKIIIAGGLGVIATAEPKPQKSESGEYGVNVTESI